MLTMRTIGTTSVALAAGGAVGGAVAVGASRLPVDGSTGFTAKHVAALVGLTAIATIGYGTNRAIMAGPHAVRHAQQILTNPGTTAARGLIAHNAAAGLRSGLGLVAAGMGLGVGATIGAAAIA